MKNRTWTSVLFKLALIGGVGVELGTAYDASAAASCAGAGFLCFYDYSSAEYGNVSGNNSDWRDFSWSDRADIFKNDGRTSKACVYKDINYDTLAWFIPRNGLWYDVPDNTVSSNKWTTGSGPADCF